MATHMPAAPSEPHTSVDLAVPTPTHPEIKYLTGIALYLMTASLTTMAFIMTFNASVVATAIPSITSTFHSIDDIGWYGAAYLVTNCALQPLTGKIYSLYSSKYTFLAFICIFELGSLLSGVARSSAMLIVGRAITGIGGSGMVGGAFTILGAMCPLHKRPRLIGIVSGIGALGQIIGPTIGGALTEHLSWRWCFYLNLPIGGAVFLIFLLVRFPDSPKSPPDSWRQIPDKLDLVGFVAFAPAVIMFLLALQWGGTTHPWSSPTILGLFIGAAAVFLIFVFWEHNRGETAMIPMALLKQRVVYCACITAITQTGGLLLLSYFMPTWFQLVKGDSPTLSGVSILPTFVSQILSSVLTGFLVTRVGYYLPFSVAGSAITTIGAGLFTTYTPHSPASQWISFQIMTGAGRGMVLQQTILAVQANTSPEVLPIVSALIPFCQYFGSALGVSLGTTVFTNRLPPALRMYAPDVEPQVVISAGATSIRHLVSSKDLPGVVLAANKALTETFYLGIGASGLAFIACWGLGWNNIKKEKQKKEDLEGMELFANKQDKIEDNVAQLPPGKE